MMNALDGIDDKYLIEALSLHEDIADSPRRAKSPTLFMKRFAAVAACLLIVVALVPLAFIISQNFNKSGDIFDPMMPGADFETPPTEDFADGMYGVKIAYAPHTDAIPSGALNLDKLSVDSVQHLPIYKVDSLAALDELKQGWGIDLDESCENVPSFNEVTDGLDDAFFAENTMLIVYASAADDSHSYGVREVYIEGGELCVHVERIGDASTSDNASGRFVILMIADGAIEDCTSFDADLGNFK